MSEPFEQVSGTAVQSITSLYKHRWGIPLIPRAYSMLSQQEWQVLVLAEELSRLKLQLAGVYEDDQSFDQDQIKELQDLSGRLKTHDLILKRVLTAREMSRNEEREIQDSERENQRSSKRDRRLDHLVQIRDKLDFQVMQRLNTIKSLAAEITQLERDNASLHQRNQALMNEISNLSTKSIEQKESQFSTAERARYETLKQSILANKSKADVLSELIVALVIATGISWADDRTLRDLILKCGESSLQQEKFLFDS